MNGNIFIFNWMLTAQAERGAGHSALKVVLLVSFAVLSASASRASDPRIGDSPSTDGNAPSGRIGVLTLINGNTIAGQLCASDSPEVIQWQGAEFTEPFQLRTGAIKSIKFPVGRDQQSHTGEFAFEFSSGDVVSGRLAGWSNDAIEIQADQFGTMIVRPDSIRRLHRIEENATLVYASLSGLQDWTTTAWDTSGWEEDGNHLWTEKPGATLNGDLRVPQRAVVEFEISWKDKPDFVFAIGVDTESESDSHMDGWRFETVGGKLAIVGEQDTTADIDFVADLSNRQSIRLSAFVDQRTGSMQVLLPDGKAAGNLTRRRHDDAEPDGGHGRGVRLVNRGSYLKLERLRIAQWLGKTPSVSDGGQASIALADGSFVSGGIRGYERKSASLLIGDGDHESPVKLSDVIAIKLATAHADAQQAQCALFLHGGMRLSGDLDAIDANHWIISGHNFSGVVRVPRDRVRSMIVFQHDGVDLDPGLKLGRLGRLELGKNMLTGRLTPSSETDAKSTTTTSASPLRWHPLASENASPLLHAASGRIVYQDPPRANTSSTAARALAMQRLRLQQQKRGLNFGQLFLERVDNAPSKSIERDAHVIHIRAGDVVACRIESIDETGVHLSTNDSDHGFVPHAKVKAIEFVTNSPPPDLKEAKRNRLLTVPRLQKLSPPTHLICSHTGDFLRCRLLRIDDETVHIEVQLETMTIPRERVAQIIWFHPDEMQTPTEDEEKDESAVQPDEATSVDDVQSSFEGMAQVLKRDGKRVTFEPQEITEKIVTGSSELLGSCRFDLFEIDQLIFGSRIGLEVSDLAFNRWKLHPALEPLVAQAIADGPNVGSESSLIGQDAPVVNLELLDGSEFRLSEFKGQVVVLDFWASWCAPCMQTMPLLEEAISEFDSEQVRLVSINLEEPADHVRSVLERHDMHLTVALDVDGIAAARYQARAIPQLVIVGPDGKVKRLYVGGGEGVVEQMKTAITELLESASS